KNTITTGNGNDSVNAGLAADTITIDGTGTKTIYIKKGDGNDTIAFSGKGVNAKVVLAFDYDQDSPDFTGYGFKKSGNNLIIERSWLNEDETTKTETTTIKDYFKNKPDIILKRDSSEDEIPLSEFIDGISINGNMSKENTLTGTKYNDFINGGNKVDKISTGNGNDAIYALGGNDKITINGSGNKDIFISRNDGNDTILFDLDKVNVNEKINVNIYFEDIYGLPEHTTYSVASNQEDLIIKNKYNAVGKNKALTQTITVKNYFGNTNKVNLTVGEMDVYEILLENKGEVTVKDKTIIGTPFDDEIVGTNKADTIYGYAGNDVILATKGNDKIYGGDGDDRYVYDGFTNWERGVVANLGHDTIYNSNGKDTISILGIEENYTMANYFEPNIVHETSRVYPSYVDNQFYDRPHWYKNGNDLVLSSTSNWNSKYTNNITLKDYFKAGKDGFGVKYLDNGEAKYIESDWLGYWDDNGEWVPEIVRNENYEAINILDNAALCFDGNVTPDQISWLKSNNFTGTFMNDIIRGSSKPDVLKGGDGNDIIYGNFANGDKKDSLYGDAGNDIIFASDTKAYGGTGNDIFVSDYLDGSDIISDETGYDRLSLRNRQYLTYFDVTQKDGKVTSTGDIYIKDISKDVSAIREISQTYNYVRLDESGRPAINEYTGSVIYDGGSELVDAVVARYVGRPVFEVSDAYCELLKDDPSILEKFDDYGEDKRFLDGYQLASYEARDGYKLVFANWDFYVKDYEYEYCGTDVSALTSYDNYKDNIYPDSYLYQCDEDYVQKHNNLIGLKENDDYAWDRGVYALNSERINVAGIRSILQDAEAGVVIKNGTKEATAIETITLDRGATDTTVSGVDARVDNMAIGDYSQEKVNDVAKTVAEWLNADDNKFTSVQDAIKRGTNAQLAELFELFDGVYEWTENVKYRQGSSAYTDSMYGGKIVGTAIVEDNIILGPVSDSTYEMSFTSNDRASMISDYSGDDTLILDNSENGYSFLFDVEVDKKGNILNYSRDFYVKFTGEEAKNTGVTICYGREQRHAIENIYEGEERIFSYNQDTIDEVRQNVAGWLTENGYASVQDVLHGADEADINSMMAQFAPINNLQEYV
ncbi:MAG: hypothetical protein K6A44_08095, partial [bacterium]|nr:hypothetical protein [bacterium]